MCLDFFLGCCSSGHRCSHNVSYLDVCLYYVTIQNLVYGCGRPLLKAGTNHRHTVANMCSNPLICPSSFLQAYNAIPFKWLKLFNRCTYSSAGHVANTVCLSKHHNYCLQSQNRDCKDRPSECQLITDDPTNEALTLQLLSMHILYPGANEPTLRVLHFFFWQCICQKNNIYT